MITESPWYAHGTTCASGLATDSTVGNSPPVIASLAGSSVTSSQDPSRVIPIGTTSYFSRSMTRNTFPPPRQEIACSGPRPPNTTATLVLRSRPTSPPVALATR